MRKYTKKIVTIALAVALMVNVIPRVPVIAQEEELLVSDQIGIYGYQIKEDYDSKGNPVTTFRTIGYGPKVNEKITANGHEYTIKRTGIVFVLDPDKSGKSDNAQLDETYTMIDKDTRTGDGMFEHFTGYKTCTGIIDGEETEYMPTLAYLSTDAGYYEKLSTVNGRDKDNNPYPLGTGFVRTFENMGELVTNTFQMRTFVLTTTGEIIYSSKIEKMSIASIAYKLYIDGRMPSEQGHEFIYNNILKGKYTQEMYEKDATYPYYWTSDKTVEHGWSIIVKPNSNK